MPADHRRLLNLRAPGRLHLGFLDPAGSLGRRFGSIGVVVDGFETVVELRASSTDEVTAAADVAGADVERAAAHLQALRERSGRHERLQLRLLHTLPAHAGLGSGTQLALAIGRVFARWHGLDLATPALAQWLGRGLRSGVGIAGFDQGGLLVDGGPGADGAPAPLLSRLEFPSDWRIVVVQDGRRRGLSGAQERHAMATLPPLSQAAAAGLCHQVLMRVLPGVASADFAAFAAGVNGLQRVLGAHFAPAQQGSAYTSEAVGRVLRWIGQASGGDAGAAIGQSSWGPTGFAIVASLADAQSRVAAAQAAGVVDPALTLRIVGGRNRGALITEAWSETPSITPEHERAA